MSVPPILFSLLPCLTDSILLAQCSHITLMLLTSSSASFFSFLLSLCPILSLDLSTSPSTVFTYHSLYWCRCVFGALVLFFDPGLSSLGCGPKETRWGWGGGGSLILPEAFLYIHRHIYMQACTETVTVCGFCRETGMFSG